MSNPPERDYRETLNLPKTDFPMKADLPKREPDRVAWWEERRTYERRLERNARNAPWILHDGPPYANGELHMGHFLNMVLKDIFVKIALLDSRWAKFVPGWDMHGLPIELETLKHLKIKDFHDVDPVELREKCKERALYWLDRQRSVRMRMGNFGDWQHPYRTIDPEFEVTIVETLGTLASKNQIYKGLRSTLWCIHDETALAEAEIEYKPRVSPSVTVRFTANDAQRDALLIVMVASSVMVSLSNHPEQRTEGAAVEGPPKVSILIWTTTPWTLPANAAIALRPDAEYGLYAVGDEAVIVADALAEKTLGDRFAGARRIGGAKGSALEGLTVRHPFMDRDAPIVLADYVDMETGTGAVHTAPGHGADDFETGVKYNLPIVNPVDSRGIFMAEAGPYAGMHIWKANPKIVEDLRASGALWDYADFEHSYPHCWRCHNPVIFRATAQWFIAMDQNRLRARTIENIRSVQWTPAWGQERIAQMLETHPEWCISRQRTWGTPIPAVVCKACGESILDPEVARVTAGVFRERGANAWWSDPVDRFLPPNFACSKCRGTSFEKEKNIVDIWFESGVTHLAVLGKNGLPWPSDLVLEGGDQYRGWFRSSIVTATAVKGAPPYKHVVKNGWVNDESGRPMSKSLGTGIDAQEAMQKWGADVLRLWAASVEFVDDVRFGPHVIEQVSRVYRNIRNRLRFMVSNLGDMAPADLVARENMEPFDALACEQVDRWTVTVLESLRDYDLHGAYLEIVRFEGDDLSSFYFDALKDRLYSSAAGASRRRSAQSALFYILQRVLTVLAPLLSFTAEEAWQAIPPELRRSDSVFDLSFESRRPAGESSAALWQLLKELRQQVAANESPRDFETDAGSVVVPESMLNDVTALGDGLREALVVSQVERIVGDGEERRVYLQPASGSKCKRCWKYLPLGNDPAHPSLCAPCAEIVTALP